jgi:4-hydroxybenzoate polyprenyltransferase
LFSQRPLPRKRITPAAAQTLLLLTIPVVLLAAYGLGAGPESAVLVALTWMYNDLGGGNGYYWVRNGILASAFAVYNIGSLKLAVGEESTMSSNGLEWIAIISAVILTTIHVQDLKDQAGDE